MANKFTKSVLERQAKELKAPKDKSKEQPISGGNIEGEASAASSSPKTPPAEKENIPKSPPNPIKETISPQAKVPALPDLSDFIIKDTSRKAKNKTFYLDDAVIEGIKKTAAAQKITESKLVNDIFKKLLGL